MGKMMPKSGAFPLQKVLEFRKHLEDMRAIELGKVQAEKIQTSTRLNRLETHKEEVLESTKNEMIKKSSVDLTQLKIRKGYIENLNDKIVHQTEKLKVLETEEEKSRRELGEAMKERKIVEKLKEKFMNRKKAEANRKENEKIDEVAVRMSSSAYGEKGV